MTSHAWLMNDDGELVNLNLWHGVRVSLQSYPSSYGVKPPDTHTVQAYVIEGNGDETRKTLGSFERKGQALAALDHLHESLAQGSPELRA